MSGGGWTSEARAQKEGGEQDEGLLSPWPTLTVLGARSSALETPGLALLHLEVVVERLAKEPKKGQPGPRGPRGALTLEGQLGPGQTEVRKRHHRVARGARRDFGKIRGGEPQGSLEETAKEGCFGLYDCWFFILIKCNIKFAFFIF